jgi:hypothetical protein
MLSIFAAVGVATAQQQYIVTNNAPSGPGSFRQAIINMNNAGLSPNEIRFQLSGSRLINITSQLPSIQRSVAINPNAVPGIILDGGGGSGNALTFAESTAQVSNVTGLEIRNFSGIGVVIAPTNTNERVNIFNCYIHDNECGVKMDTGSFHSISANCVIASHDLFGVSIGQSVQGVQIFNSAIQDTQNAGIRLAGSNHTVSGCFIVSNGQTEPVNVDFGGVVFGSINTSASNCTVSNCTLAANTPYGAKFAAGSTNKIIQNEIYLNTTKGIRTVAVPLAPPTLSHFVIDNVHGKVIVRANVSGNANIQLRVEVFTGYIPLDQGAVFCDDETVTLNSSGQGTVLFSFDRNEVFQARAVSANPVPFTIDHQDRLVATSTTAGSFGSNTSEFSAISFPTLPGDYNLDGNVDAADNVIWRNNEGATNAVYTQGDGNFDRTVNQADYDIWRSNYGATP